MATNTRLASSFQRVFPVLALLIRAYLQQITIRAESRSESASQLYLKLGPLLKENSQRECSPENSGEERAVNEHPYSNPSIWIAGRRSVNVTREADLKGLASTKS